MKLARTITKISSLHKMIPPVAPGQTEEKQNMVGWKNTFNMRQISLMNLAASQLGVKNGAKSVIPAYRRAFSITSPSKSLDILRKNLQNAINKDIDTVLKKYIDKFFQPAINNIKNNVGKDSVREDHVKEVCKQMLEEAKLMYKVSPSSRDSSPYEYCHSEAESEASLTDGRLGRLIQQQCDQKDEKQGTFDNSRFGATITISVAKKHVGWFKSPVNHDCKRKESYMDSEFAITHIAPMANRNKFIIRPPCGRETQNETTPFKQQTMLYNK